MKLLRAALRRFGQTEPVTLADLKTSDRFNFVVTSSFHRLDVAAIIRRPPIFYSLSDLEYEDVVQEHKLFSKYDLYPAVTKELVDLEFGEYLKRGTSDIPTHFKMSPEGERILYYGASKDFTQVSTKVTKKNHIQRYPMYNLYLLVKVDGLWRFPSGHIWRDESISLGKDRFFKDFSKGKFTIHFNNRLPVTVREENFYERDKENAFWMKCKGRKVFYFHAVYEDGETVIDPYFGDEIAWVTKLEISKYLTREDFEFFKEILDAK